MNEWMNEYRLISLYIGSGRQNPYQKKQKAVTLYADYSCKTCALFSIIFHVKLSQGGEMQWSKETNFSFICVRKYQNNVILICHHNNLHSVDAKMNLQHYVIHNPLVSMRVLHIVGQIKKASFWNGYITVSEPNTLNKMEITVGSYT